MSNPFTTKDPLLDVISRIVLGEKKLTDAEMKKREEIAKAMERDNPGMDMGKKMAIATAQAKKVAEEVEQIDEGASHEDVIAYADKKLKGWKKTVKHIPKPRRMEDGDPHSEYKYVHPKSGHTVQLHQLHANKKRTQVTLGKTDDIGDMYDHKDGTGGTKMPKNSNVKHHIDAALERHNKHVKEEVEQIDEAKKSTHEDPLITVHKDGRLHAHLHLSTANDLHKTDVKHTQIHAGPVKIKTKYGDNLEYKLSKWHGVKEEVEQIDELSKKTLGNYVAKAVVDVHNDARWAGETDDKDAKNKAFKRLLGVKSAASRLSQQVVPGGRINNFRRNNEEVDFSSLEINESQTQLDAKQNVLLRAMAKDPAEIVKMRRALGAGDKALGNPMMRAEILKMLDQMMDLTTSDPALLQRTKAGLMKSKRLPEDVQIDEGVKAQYRYTGGMHGEYHPTKKQSSPAAHIDAAKFHEREAKIYSKALGKKGGDDEHANRAIDFHTGAAVHHRNSASAMKEEVEQIDEISKSTVGSYIKKATNDVVNKAVLYSHDAAKVSSKAPPTRTDSDYDKLRAGERGMAKRSKGIDLAVKKLTKEEAEQVEEAKKPYRRPEQDEGSAESPSQYMRMPGVGAVKRQDSKPFEGGREVTSKTSAADRVKKIAKGMQKQYTKDKP